MRERIDTAALEAMKDFGIGSDPPPPVSLKIFFLFVHLINCTMAFAFYASNKPFSCGLSTCAYYILIVLYKPFAFSFYRLLLALIDQFVWLRRPDSIVRLWRPANVDSDQQIDVSECEGIQKTDSAANSARIVRKLMMRNRPGFGRRRSIT